MDKLFYFEGLLSTQRKSRINRISWKENSAKAFHARSLINLPMFFKKFACILECSMQVFPATSTWVQKIWIILPAGGVPVLLARIFWTTADGPPVSLVAPLEMWSPVEDFFRCSLIEKALFFGALTFLYVMAEKARPNFMADNKYIIVLIYRLKKLKLNEQGVELWS